MFDVNKCDFCGDCLASCAYVDYSREKAIEEMRALVASGEAGVLRDCITCMACNEYCEKGANPFDLISDLQERREAISVLPETMAMFEQLAASPSSILQGDSSKPALSLCTIEPFLRPDIMQSEIFRDMTLVRGGDYFCHYAMLHLGKGGTLAEHDRAFIQNLGKVKAEEIVFLHEECYIMATVKAQEFNVAVPFKATSLLEYLNCYLKENQARLKPIGRRIAYQRPCSSRAIPETEGLLKEFFDLVGVERINRRYDGKDALCCGAAIMGLGRFDCGQDVMARNMEDILLQQPAALVYLCPFCGYTFAEPCTTNRLPAIFVADLAAMALGEVPFPGTA